MANKVLKPRKAYRQGELLFVPLNREDVATLELTSSAAESSWKELKTNVLREGEATGHKHEVITQTPEAVTMLAPVSSFISGLSGMASIGNEDRALLANKPFEVIHPEHRPLRLPKGIILVIVQREYDEVKARRIMD
jgi:hypothetical protein